jgi:hypothetical protein
MGNFLGFGEAVMYPKRSAASPEREAAQTGTIQVVKPKGTGQ